MDSVLKLETDQEITRRIQSLCLIGKLIWNRRVLTPESIKSLTKLQWRCKKNYQVSYIQPNLFMFTFQDSEDFKTVLSNTPYTVRGILLLLSPWVSAKIPSELQFCYSPFWVQVHNLPLDCFTEENQLKIAQLLGKAIRLDEAMYNGFVWKKYLRIRVNLDIRKPLLPGFWQNRSGLADIWIEFKYERLGDFCYKCGCIGKHHYNNCEFPEGKGSHGPWMRAGPLVYNNRGRWNRGGGGGGGGSSSSVAGGAVVVRNPNTGTAGVGSSKSVQGNGNRFANLVTSDEIEATVLIPADSTEVIEKVESEERHSCDDDDGGGGDVVPYSFLLRRVIKNIICSVIIMANCKIISSRVAAANSWENNYWSFLVLMAAYFFYLVKSFVHSVRCIRLSGSSDFRLRIKDQYNRNAIMVLLLFFMLLNFC